MDRDVATRDQQVARLMHEHMEMVIASGLIRLRVEDQSQTGESITVDGKVLINFGSCAYLGLNVDQRLKQGAIDAIERYGPVFSSSSGYASIDLYTKLETRLQQIFGGTVLVPTTTTLGHLSVLPVLVSPGDLVLHDHHVHASVILTTHVLRGLGATVVDLPHNDMEALSAALDEAGGRGQKVWYLADGVYSMYGDTAPVTEIVELLESHPNMHVYFDDAHGVGWHGKHGRGYVLSQVQLHERMIVIGSLAKSWGAGGSVLVLPNAELAERVVLVGATFTFSGPLHPAELGAAVAAADIHLSPERDRREQDLMSRIDYVRERLVEHQLPIVSLERTPIWLLRVGAPGAGIELARRMLADGFYTNVAAFPLVPLGMEGVRFMNTLYHTEDVLEQFMDALARHAPGLVQSFEGPVDLN